MSTVRRVAALCALALIAVSLWGIVRHAQAVEAVRVVLRAGFEEPHDKLPGKSALPDYKLRLRSGDDWIDCGTHKDRSAQDGLLFPVKPPVPSFDLVELELREDDKLDDDELERVPVMGDVFDGERFRFELVYGFDLQAGLAWFFGTPVGVLVALGIVMATILSFIKFDL